MQEGISFFPGEGSAFDLVYLALAHHALGRTAEARILLDKAIRLIDAPDPERKWKWEIELKLLRAEAERRLSAEAASPPTKVAVDGP